jgi:hypothetical protein
MPRRTCVGWATLLVLGAAALSRAAEDDLSVVKKAVSAQASRPQAASATRPATSSETKRENEPRWLKVRIEDRGAKRAKVSVNVPLELVKALDDDGGELPMLHGHKDGKGKAIRLGDVLRALHSGQDIVQIEDEESVIRIWVE